MVKLQFVRGHLVAGIQLNSLYELFTIFQTICTAFISKFLSFEVGMKSLLKGKKIHQKQTLRISVSGE